MSIKSLLIHRIVSICILCCYLQVNAFIPNLSNKKLFCREVKRFCHENLNNLQLLEGEDSISETSPSVEEIVKSGNISVKRKSALSISRSVRRGTSSTPTRGPRTRADVENKMMHHSTYRKMNNYT